LFDASRFGRGYGEENDFCMRAASAGWRNVLAGDVFVYHEGAVSFSEERSALTESAGKTLADLHPDYVRKVHEFVARDPASALRAAIDSARIALGTDELRHLLFERTEERNLLLKAVVEEREPLVTALREGLAQAERLLAERDVENSRLRTGLGHAEMLAFKRAREIEELHRSWAWKCREFVLRMRTWRRPPSRP
jgi:hypothetical protein